MADFDTIAELERQKRHISFDEEICYDFELDELDLSIMFDKFESIGKPLSKDKMKNLKMIKTENGNDYPTNALMILLGKFEHCTVKCARFKGTTMSVFIDKKEYGGDVFSVLDNAQSFIFNHINLKGEINGLYRTDTYEIPVLAIREALINTIVHRDYVNKGRDIKVGIYDDVVNIVSPGGLPHSITMEDVFSGRSEARNRVVAHVFKELGLIEQWGSGIIRIFNAYEEYGLDKPKIEEKNDFFDVELVRPQLITTDKLSGQTSDVNDYERLRTITNDYERLTHEKKVILIFLLDEGKISRKKASELLGLKNTKTYEILTEMVSEMLIVKHGNGRSTYYTIAQ
ncbi:MAG: hypothetical protein K9G70_12715 [Prolixibacteraceae bacterium]|nr:hypothetical protein [Prolixibacteraceae bacterium]